MIRFAEEKDLDRVQSIVTDLAWVKKSGCLEYIKKKQVIVYENNQGIIQGIIWYGKNYEKILYLIVRAKERKMGIGRRLFEYSIEQFKPERIVIWATYEPYNSTIFWQKIGFKEYYREGNLIFKVTKARRLLLMEWGEERSLFNER